MRRISLWVLSTLAALVMLLGYSTSTSGPVSSTTAYSVHSGGSGSSTSSSAAAASTTVTGPVVQTRWGPVQVQLNVSDGRIDDVTVLQYPDGNGKDQQINGYALPILTQETLDTQSAGIDMVSGATVTSTGYIQSLQSALDQAGL